MYIDYDKCCEVGVLVGKTLTSVEVSDDKEHIKFHCSDGSVYGMCHNQYCCEHVSVDSITGDLDDLVGTPIVVAEEVSSEGTPSKMDLNWKGTPEPDESFTWTFYRFRTIKGDVDIRWYGYSNGYYSESVDFGLLSGPVAKAEGRSNG